MNSKLDNLEARLQAFIEGSLKALMPWGQAEQSLAHQLVGAMQDNLTERDGVVEAPVVYTIFVNPARLSAWQAEPAIVNGLATVLKQAGEEAGIRFAVAPVIRVAIDGALTAHEARVVTSDTSVDLGNTAAFELAPEQSEPSGEIVPQNVFLIVNGLRIFQVEQSVINIGRRQDNHLVIDDPRVSRAHAQLRLIKGNFVIYDLNSSGGTYVNSQRVTRCLLKPGDVVSLAGIPLVFGIDSAADDGKTGHARESLTPGSTSQFPAKLDNPAGKTEE